MTNVATYQNISDNVPENMRFLAFVVLPNGEYWGVRFSGATEEIAKTKAIALWTKENAKWDMQHRSIDDIEEYEDVPANPLVTPSGRGKHFAGKVWMRHATEGLKRVALTEIALYEKNGYFRSGPRSK